MSCKRIRDPSLVLSPALQSIRLTLARGSERIPVGFGKVRLRSAFAALDDEILGESAIVEEQRCLPGWDNAVDTV